MHQQRKIILFIVALFLLLSTQACGMKYNIKGRVVDSETGKPIEGAAVSLHWFHYQLIPSCVGLTSGFEHLATYETLTDPDGYFEITKRLTGEYDMEVYKMDYVCWSDDHIFNPGSNGANLKREGFELENDMIIKLEPFKNDYSRENHAEFVIKYISNTHNGPIFNNAIQTERAIFFRSK